MNIDKLLEKAELADDTYELDPDEAALIHRLIQAVRELRDGAYGKWCAKLVRERNELRDRRMQYQRQIVELEKERDELQDTLKLARKSADLWEAETYQRIKERDELRAKVDGLGLLAIQRENQFVELTRKLERAKEAVERAQEWAAGYPLGHGHDDFAAKDIYFKCKEALAAIDDRGEEADDT